MKPGDVVPVTNSNRYTLPEGLEDGDLVKLISLDHGYWTVERHGREYTVFVIRLQPGFEFDLNGRWLPDSDPRIPAILEKTTLRHSKAAALLNGAILYPDQSGRAYPPTNRTAAPQALDCVWPAQRRHRYVAHTTTNHRSRHPALPNHRRRGRARSPSAPLA